MTDKTNMAQNNPIEDTFHSQATPLGGLSPTAPPRNKEKVCHLSGEVDIFVIQWPGVERGDVGVPFCQKSMGMWVCELMLSSKRRLHISLLALYTPY